MKVNSQTLFSLYIHFKAVLLIVWSQFLSIWDDSINLQPRPLVWAQTLMSSCLLTVLPLDLCILGPSHSGSTQTPKLPYPAHAPTKHSSNTLALYPSQHGWVLDLGLVLCEALFSLPHIPEIILLCQFYLNHALLFPVTATTTLV